MEAAPPQVAAVSTGRCHYGRRVSLGARGVFAAAHFPFGPRGSMVSGRHRHIWLVAGPRMFNGSFVAASLILKGSSHWSFVSYVE